MFLVVLSHAESDLAKEQSVNVTSLSLHLFLAPQHAYHITTSTYVGMAVEFQ